MSGGVLVRLGLVELGGRSAEREEGRSPPISVYISLVVDRRTLNINKECIHKTHTFAVVVGNHTFFSVRGVEVKKI